MKSELERAASFIESLSNQRKTAFLARLMYELTLAGRASYSVDSSGVDQPNLLREINELQHQVSAQLMGIISGGTHTRSSTSFAALFLESNFENQSHRIVIKNSLIDAITAMLDQSAEAE